MIIDLIRYGISFEAIGERVFIVKDKTDEVPSFDWSKRISEYEAEISEVYYRNGQLIDMGWDTSFIEFVYSKKISETTYVKLEQTDVLTELALYQIDKDINGKEKTHRVAIGESYAMITLAKLISERLEAQKGGEK